MSRVVSYDWQGNESYPYSDWDHEIINQDKCQTCKFHLDAFPNGTPCWKCLEGSPLTVSGKYYKKWVPSNADLIRGMTDEELADFLTGDFCELLCGSPLFCGGQCKEKCLEWLKKEIDE